MPATTLRLILGDQLDLRHPWFEGDADAVYVLVESRAMNAAFPQQVRRLLGFLAAMRRFAADLGATGRRVRYFKLNDADNPGDFEGALDVARRETGAGVFEWQEPDDWALDARLDAYAATYADSRRHSRHHFLDTKDGVAKFFGPRRRLMESYYRDIRKRHGLLMTPDGKPVGGAWNYDAENRRPWRGTPPLPASWDEAHDLREVHADIVASGLPVYGDAAADRFPWPLDRAGAERAAKAFLDHALPHFGDFEDAMVTGSDRLFHSRLSFALNLGLLRPMELCRAVEARHRRDPERFPINAVEGFIRQIAGWREYVRGVYWVDMPGLAEANALGHSEPLPALYWTGKTRMNCMARAICQSVETGYAHHIQRLMLAGGFALAFGVRPQEIERWFLGVYVDALEWVEMPNTLAMSQHADGGRMTTKPYLGAANYIGSMSDYCSGCSYDRKARIGADACPFNTLYWDFWLRHSARFIDNPRIGMAPRAALKIPPAEQAAIRARADFLRANADAI